MKDCESVFGADRGDEMCRDLDGDRFLERKLDHDHEIVQRVVSGLQRRLGSPVHELEITEHSDGLILKGIVRSHYGKQMTQEIVRQEIGLPVLANEIEVQITFEETRSGRSF